MPPEESFIKNTQEVNVPANLEAKQIEQRAILAEEAYQWSEAKSKGSVYDPPGTVHHDNFSECDTDNSRTLSVDEILKSFQEAESMNPALAGLLRHYNKINCLTPDSDSKTISRSDIIKNRENAYQSCTRFVKDKLTSNEVNQLRSDTEHERLDLRFVVDAIIGGQYSGDKLAALYMLVFMRDKLNVDMLDPVPQGYKHDSKNHPVVPQNKPAYELPKNQKPITLNT